MSAARFADAPDLGEGVPMLAQLAMLALSILAIAAAFLAIRPDRSERAGGDEEAAPGPERRWTRVRGKRRR